MGEPLHVPVEADNVWPTTELPETTGNAVFAGAETLVVITALWAETAVVDPPLFVAVTAMRIVKPTSLLVNPYEAELAPLTATQLAPVVSQ